MDTLDPVRQLIDRIAGDLDPDSRYISDLLAVVDASVDVADLERRLTAGCRGQRHAGAHLFARMTLEEKLRCNLITNETVLFRFAEGEWDVLQERILPQMLESGRGRILCAPCSHGEEAFSLAAACLQAGVAFSIDAVDVQPQCIAEAQSGRLTMGFPLQHLETPAQVGSGVLEQIRFAVGDLLQKPGTEDGPGAGPWDLVVCRNFLGYFQAHVARSVALGLAERVSPGGALFVDSFCLGKFPALSAELAEAGMHKLEQHPVFVR